MANPTCFKAFTQIANVALVYVKVSGLVNGSATYRNCKLQRLRTVAGGRDVIHSLRTVDINGKSMDSAQQLDAIKEANRYQVDSCRDASPTDDPMNAVVAPFVGVGLLDVSDEQWAQLRTHTATEDELQAVPDSWDERDAVTCPNAQAIQLQGECGKPSAAHPAEWRQLLLCNASTPKECAAASLCVATASLCVANRLAHANEICQGRVDSPLSFRH
jgi:hypothetical protein